jgi:hypothetical protein
MDLVTTAQVLGNFGEFFGAIAVVATLVYLAVQIRQNSTQVRLNSIQVSIERWSGMISSVLDDPERFAMWRDGLEHYSSLAPEQQAQFHAQMMRGMTAYTHNLERVESGVLPREIWQNQRLDLARILKCPGTKQWMESLVLEAGEQAQFAAFLNTIVEADSDVVPLNQGLPFLHKRNA